MMIGNNITKTEHPKIILIKEKLELPDNIKSIISEFKDKTDSKNIEKTKKLIKKIVKDFNPKN